MPTYTKDPDATLKYTFDWSDWLDTGETISSANITADAGITIDSQSNDTTTADATLSGGTVGESYGVTCRVTTNGGQTDDRSITITIAER